MGDIGGELAAHPFLLCALLLYGAVLLAYAAYKWSQLGIWAGIKIVEIELVDRADDQSGCLEREQRGNHQNQKNQ